MQHKSESSAVTDETTHRSHRYSAAQLAKFLLPTLLGVLLFLTPISVDGRLTVLIAFVIDYINDVIKPLMVPVTVAVAVIPSALTVLVTFSSLKEHPNRFVQLLNPGVGWTLIRVVGATLMLMTYFQWGPEWVWHRNTGGVLLYDVGPWYWPSISCRPCCCRC